MSDLQILAQIKRDTGRTVRLYPLEEISHIKQEADKVAVMVRRRWTRERRYGALEVTHEGLSIYTFVRRGDRWIALEPFTQRWSIEPVLHTSIPARPRDTEWEALCYRPGTDTHPLDNPGRVAQRNQWGY